MRAIELLGQAQRILGDARHSWVLGPHGGIPRSPRVGGDAGEERCTESQVFERHGRERTQQAADPARPRRRLRSRIARHLRGTGSATRVTSTPSRCSPQLRKSTSCAALSAELLPSGWDRKSQLTQQDAVFAPPQRAAITHPRYLYEPNPTAFVGLRHELLWQSVKQARKGVHRGFLRRPFLLPYPEWDIPRGSTRSRTRVFLPTPLAQAVSPFANFASRAICAP